MPNKLSPHDFPQTTKSRQPIKFDDPKGAWKDDTMPFQTERQAPKGEFGPVHVQKLEKLEPKMLPANNESLIDSSLISNDNMATPKKVIAPPIKKVMKEEKKAKARSRSEQRQKEDKELVTNQIAILIRCATMSCLSLKNTIRMCSRR